MSAHVDVHITNVPSCVHVSVPQLAPVNLTVLEGVGWLAMGKLDIAAEAILIHITSKISELSMRQNSPMTYMASPEFGDIFGDAFPFNWWNSCLISPVA